MSEKSLCGQLGPGEITCDRQTGHPGPHMTFAYSDIDDETRFEVTWSRVNSIGEQV